MHAESRRRELVAAIAVIALGAAVHALAARALAQGFDLLDQGGALLSAHLLRSGTGHFDAGTTTFADRWLAFWFELRGESVLASTRAQAWLTTLTAATGAAVAWHRRGATAAVVWALAVLAATPVSGAWTVAVTTTALVCFLRPATWRAFVAGLGLWCVAALDLRVALASLPLVAWWSHTEGRGRPLALGAMTGALVVTVSAIGSVGLARGLEQDLIGPVSELARRAGDGELLRFARTAWSGAWLDRPFGGWPPTGETDLVAWPGQGALRAWALRAVVLGTLAVLGFAGGAAWRARGSANAPRLALAATATVALVLDGDVGGIRAAILPLVATLVAWTTSGAPKRSSQSALILLTVVVCAPLAGETVWRATHLDRPSLARWEDPHGGVRLEERRARRFVQVRERLAPVPGEPVLTLPAIPGVHFVLGTTPLVPDADLPQGTEDDRRVRAALLATPPRFVLLGPDPRLLGHRLYEQLPRTWEFLRDRYRFAAVVRLEHDDFRLMAPFAEGASDPLAQRLPAVELTVANDRTPALRRGLAVGQGVVLGDRDLEGFAVRVRSNGGPIEAEFRVQVWEKRAGGYDAALFSENVRASVAGDGALTFFRVPVEETAGREIAITVELRDELREELRLDWYVHDEASEPDFYPEGSALLGLAAVDADLYLLVY